MMNLKGLMREARVREAAVKVKQEDDELKGKGSQAARDFAAELHTALQAPDRLARLPDPSTGSQQYDDVQRG